MRAGHSTTVPVTDAGAGAGSSKELPKPFAPRPVPARWPAGKFSRAEILSRAGTWWSGLGSKDGAARRRGLTLLLDWLENHPGQTWQERWRSSGAEDARSSWAELPAAWLERRGIARWRLETMTSAVAVLVSADVLRPSLTWILTGGKKRKLAVNLYRWRDPEGFRRLNAACEQEPGIGPTVPEQIAFRCAMVMAAKGGILSDIVVGDVLEILNAEIALRGRAVQGPATLKVLRKIGVLDPNIPSLRELRSAGQRSVEELVDRYRIACAPIRDLLVEYLKERQPAVDYTSLQWLSYVLARCFWVDIETHNPGIDTLALEGGVASAWKQRLRTRTAITKTPSGETREVSVERLSYLDVMGGVRAFYLGVSCWMCGSNLKEPDLGGTRR